jgi:acyl carrier protein
MVEIALDIEKEFNIFNPDEEMKKVQTLAELKTLITKCVAAGAQ